MPKIKIVATKRKGNRLALHVQFDSGKQFWYITTADRTKEDIIASLENKYEQSKEASKPEKIKKMDKLRKELEGMEIG